MLKFISATIQHARDIADLHALSWQNSYRGTLSDDYLDNQVFDERLALWRKRLSNQSADQFVMLALDDEEPLGFIYIAGKKSPEWGALLDNLHIRPEAKGKGLGKALMQRGAHWLAETYPDDPKMYLIVFEANQAACRFYEHLGGEVREQLPQPMPDGVEVPSRRYVWGDVKTLIPNPLSGYLAGYSPTGHLETDVENLLMLHNKPHTFTHVQAVAAKAVELAERFGGKIERCRTAAWLHDISAIVPNSARIPVSKALGVDVIHEEEIFPMIVHQKLSVPIASEAFGIEDSETLSAIGCHTTLKADPSLTDLIVFVADKIAWDQPGDPPYIDNLLPALDTSIEAAALVYLDYLWEMRDKLRVLHPMTVEARNDLLGIQSS